MQLDKMLEKSKFIQIFRLCNLKYILDLISKSKNA